MFNALNYLLVRVKSALTGSLSCLSVSSRSLLLLYMYKDIYSVMLAPILTYSSAFLESVFRYFRRWYRKPLLCFFSCFSNVSSASWSSMLFRILLTVCLVIFLKSSTVGKYLRSKSVGLFVSMPYSMWRGISSWFTHSLTANFKLIWLRWLWVTSDSTRDMISGKGLNECRSAIEHGVCPVCADDKGNDTCRIWFPHSNIKSRVFMVALHSVNLVPGALRGLILSLLSQTLYLALPPRWHMYCFCQLTLYTWCFAFIFITPVLACLLIFLPVQTLYSVPVCMLKDFIHVVIGIIDDVARSIVVWRLWSCVSNACSLIDRECCIHWCQWYTC